MEEELGVGKDDKIANLFIHLYLWILIFCSSWIGLDAMAPLLSHFNPISKAEKAGANLVDLACSGFAAFAILGFFFHALLIARKIKKRFEDDRLKSRAMGQINSPGATFLVTLIIFTGTRAPAFPSTFRLAIGLIFMVGTSWLYWRASQSSKT